MVVSAQCATPLDPQGDLTLVHAALRGDMLSFEKLVRRNDLQLLRIAQSVTRSSEQAENAVRDAFFKAYQRLDQFTQNTSFPTWVMRILLNEVGLEWEEPQIAQRKLPGGILASDCQILPRDLAAWPPNLQDLYYAEELREILLNCLCSLHTTLRIVFVLRDIEELSIGETADALNLSHVAVKAQLFCARLQLRELLTRYMKERNGEPLCDGHG
jgi:RNA polymerase sigma-70 factor, ECF subfamily